MNIKEMVEPRPSARGGLGRPGEGSPAHSVRRRLGRLSGPFSGPQQASLSPELEKNSLLSGPPLVPVSWAQVPVLSSAFIFAFLEFGLPRKAIKVTPISL